MPIVRNEDGGWVMRTKSGLMPLRAEMDFRYDNMYKKCRIKRFWKRYLRKWRDKQIDKFLKE